MTATIRTAAVAQAEINEFFAEAAERKAVEAVLATRFINLTDAYKAVPTVEAYFAGSETLVTVWAQQIPDDQRGADNNWLPDAFRVIPATADTLREMVAEAATQPYNQRAFLLDTYGMIVPSEFIGEGYGYEVEWIDAPEADGVDYDDRYWDFDEADYFGVDYPEFPA